MIQKRTTAFTLGELMVVLVVSSIVVTIAFFALSSVQRQIRTIQFTYENQQKIQYTERLLLGDLNTYKGYYDDKNNLLLLRDSKDSVHYRFYNDRLVREQDTIRLSLVSKKMYLLGEEVESGPIDALELQFSNTFSTNSIFVYKIHDASHYLEEEWHLN